jgi:hypothetical protein
MSSPARALIALISLAQCVAWTVFTLALWRWGNSLRGSSDGGPAASGSFGAELFGYLVITLIWILFLSPYLCAIAATLGQIRASWMPAVYFYVLFALTIMTLFLLGKLQKSLGLMALGNILAAALWAYSFREKAPRNIDE